MEKAILYLSHKLIVATRGYGGKEGLWVLKNSSISDGDSSNSQVWRIQNHFGTHIDTPGHFFNDGQTIDSFPPDYWCCENIRVLEVCAHKNEIIPLSKIRGYFDTECDCLLIKTGFEQYRGTNVFWEENPGINPEIAFWIRENCPRLKLIGIDLVSISAWTNREIGRIAHKAFLDPKGKGREIIIVEDMHLSGVDADTNIEQIVFAPLVVENSDASPCTVFAKIRRHV